MLVDIGYGEAVDKPFGHHIAVIFGIFSRVEGHEDIWGDTTAAVDSPLVDESLAPQRVDIFYAVAVHQFAVVESILDIPAISILVSLSVRLLYIAAGGSVIMRHGQSNHGAVWQRNGTLHETLPNVRRPTMTPRSQSCTAPDVISAAEAVY